MAESIAATVTGPFARNTRVSAPFARGEDCGKTAFAPAPEADTRTGCRSFPLEFSYSAW